MTVNQVRLKPLHRNGGEDGIRTHAALANPNDLANRPLQPLEYFSRLNIDINYLQTSGRLTVVIEPSMAERVGFEPTAPFGVTGFQDQLLKPLGHLSIYEFYSDYLNF